jgi:GAF domain-containing protein
MMRLLASQAVSSTPEAAASSTDRNDLHALIALALQVGGMAAATMRVHDMLVEVCRALPRAANAAGAALVLTGSVDVCASDPQAAWLAELQRRSGAGPLGYALRSGRPMCTPDLTRVGPPDLAAAAAERELVTSVVMPLVARDRSLGGLQLLGDAGRHVGTEHVELLRPLVAALSARLVDVLAIEELNRAARPAAPVSVPVPRAPWADVESHGVAEASGADPHGTEPHGTGDDQTIGWFGPVEPQPDASVDGVGR